MRLICSLLLLVWPLAAEPADWIWSARYVVTMDGGRRVIENGAVAVRGRPHRWRGHAVRHRDEVPGAPAHPDSPSAHRSRSDQYPHARGDVAVPRHRQRPPAPGLAREVHLSGRGQERQRRLRSMGNPPGLSGDGAGRHHHIHRHVLLRGRRRGSGQGGRPARGARRNGPQLPRPRREDSSGCAGLRGTLHPPLSRRSAHHPGRGAARALYQHRRIPALRARAGQPVQRPAAHTRFGDEAGERRFGC